MTVNSLQRACQEARQFIFTSDSGGLEIDYRGVPRTYLPSAEILSESRPRGRSRRSGYCIRFEFWSTLPAAIGISVLLNLSRASNHARGIAPDKQRDNRKDARRHRSCDWPKNDGHADIPLTHRPRHSYLSASVGSTRNARLGRRSNHQLSGAAAEIHFLFDALNWRSRVVPRKAELMIVSPAE